MSLKKIRRDVILFVMLTLVLSVSGVAFVRQVAAPPQTVPSHQQTSPPSAPRALPSPVSYTKTQSATVDSHANYELIARRNFFKPPTQPAPPPVEPTPEPTISLQPTPTVSQPATPTTLLPASTPSPVTDIAVTGIVTVDNQPQAIVEFVATHDSRTVRQGDTVYGYQLDEIGSESVTVSRGGERFQLWLGENKVAQPPKAPPSASGASMGSKTFPINPTTTDAAALAAYTKAMKQIEGGKGNLKLVTTTPAEFVNRELARWQERMARDGRKFKANKELQRVQDRYLKEMGQEMPDKLLRRFKGMVGQ